MKTSRILAMVVALLAVGATGILRAHQAQTTAKKAARKKVIYVSADKATFKAPPGTGAGAAMATLWGNPDKGAHGTFTKFEPGYDAGMHTHTSDLWIAVIKGAYLYKDEDGEKRVGAGDFLRVPGGHKHWSGGDKTEGALFYEEGAGKFDLIPAQ